MKLCTIYCKILRTAYWADLQCNYKKILKFKIYPSPKILQSARNMYIKEPLMMPWEKPGS